MDLRHVFLWEEMERQRETEREHKLTLLWSSSIASYAEDLNGIDSTYEYFWPKCFIYHRKYIT